MQQEEARATARSTQQTTTKQTSIEYCIAETVLSQGCTTTMAESKQQTHLKTQDLSSLIVSELTALTPEVVSDMQHLWTNIHTRGWMVMVHFWSCFTRGTTILD